MAKKEIIVAHGQSIWDIALQQYGSGDGVKQLILDNPATLNYSDRPAAGLKVVIDDEKVINKKVVEFFAEPRVLPPATGFVNVNNSGLAEGVWNDQGYWYGTENWFDN